VNRRAQFELEQLRVRLDGCWKQTYTGRSVNPLRMRPEDFDLRDIAHALSLKCRYGGHCREFYSVAEHSVRIDGVLQGQGEPIEVVRWGLAHDCAEAYLGDVASPVKRMPELDGYRLAEEHNLAMLAERYRLGWPIPAAVHVADRRMLMTEKRDLMGPEPAPWMIDAEPYDDVAIEPWRPAVAERRFAAEWKRLGLEP
jgi:uncharacterized protein